MRRLLEMWLDWRYPPKVVIDYFGQLTSSPQVNVAIVSRHGAQSVYTFDADQVGDAKASLYGKGLAEIAGLRLVDSRT